MNTPSIGLYVERGFLRDIANLTPQEIDFHWIAINLNCTMRFNGWHGGWSPDQPIRPLTVLEHSLHCYDLAVRNGETDDDFLLALLLHDTGEAYVGDIPRPLKKHLPLVQDIETSILKVVCTVAGISYHKNFVEQHDRIKKYDMLSFDHEFQRVFCMNNAADYPIDSNAADRWLTLINTSQK